MPGRRLTLDIAFDRGDAVNWLGCNGHVIALIVLDGCVQYEVQFLDNQGQACLGRFQQFELEEGHED